MQLILTQPMAYPQILIGKKYGMKTKYLILKIKTKVPVLDLNLTGSNFYSLKNSTAKYVVLYFYSNDETLGCTIETNVF